MRNIIITGVAIAALMVSQPAFAEIDSRVGAPPVVAAPAPALPPMAAGPDRRKDYQRPSYGFQLPSEWMSSENSVDYREYDLDRPARGFGWSRYYDDMVLTDQWGRVYDVADSYDHGGREMRYRGRETDGVVGGVAGAAVGAVSGNVIAGAGSRLAGSLIGGGVGALVGLGVELALKKGRHGHRYDDRAHDGGYDRGHARSHWSAYPAQAWGYQDCGCGSDTITTTTVTYHGGGGTVVPRQIVTYENFYAPARTKYVPRAVAPTGKIRERTRLHTRTY